MKRVFAVIFVVTFLAAVVCAQNPPQAPQPAPELKRLNYFVGVWTTEADMKRSPYGPGGKFNGTDHAAWMAGNFFGVPHPIFKGPWGPGPELRVWGPTPR